MSIYYQDEHVTLHHGDCIDIMSDLISGSADPLAHIAVTSPPYNMGVTPGGNGRGIYRTSKTSKGRRFHSGYADHDDAMNPDEYVQWQRRAIQVMWDAIASDGAIFYNHKVRIEHGVARLPLDMNFPVPLRQIITWDRGTGIGVNLRHYASVAEWILIFAKADFKLRDHSASGAGDVWRLGLALDKHDHPAPFPESLPMKAITTSSARSVIDPFAGSGTTLVAARKAGIAAVGIEKSERYCEIIARRLDQGVLDLSGIS